MNKIIIIGLTLALLIGGAYYFNTHQSRGHADSFTTWKEFIPQSKLFKVSLPNTPQYAKDLIDIPNSDKKRRYDMYASEKIDGTLFLISVITYPPEVDTSSTEEILQQNIDELMRSKPDNKLIKLLDGVFEEQRTFDFAIENQMFHVEGKAIENDHTIYMLTYITQKANFDPIEYQHFVDSFKLLNKKH